MSVDLRPYQSDMIARARAAMQAGTKALILEAPTGSGKTLLTAYMLKTAAAKGVRCWFVVHRVELLRQSVETFGKVGVDFGIVAVGFTPDPDKSVQICSIQALRRRLSRLPQPGLIVWDECHHVAAKSWAAIHASFPQVFHVGLSATPERLDGKGLGAYFKEMVKGPEVRWLIENGYLADYRLVVPPGSVDTTGVHKTMGDFNKAELAKVADAPTITGNAVREYQKRCSGKRALARGVSIVHSRHIAEQFNAAGIPARHVDGDTPREERREAMAAFIRGEILVLTNVDLFSEGVDCPALEAVIDLRPTQSLTLWLQFCGRALRPFPGKPRAVIIDMAGNAMRHGLPCEVRDWDLAGRAKKKSGDGGGTKIRICQKCFGAQIGFPEKCAYCGFVFPVGDGREVEQVDGELVEVDVEKARIAKIQAKREQGMARTLPELIALGKKRQYNNPVGWAYSVLRARGASA